MKGYVVRYEPRAYAAETASVSIKDEQKRKVRISAGAFQAMGMLKELFNVFKYPVLSFQFISHRILRWTLCPVCLVLLLITNIALVMLDAGWVYPVFLGLQAFFYLLAITGWLYANRNIKLKLLYIPYYFLFMNLSVFLGFSRFVKKRQTVLWEKAARQKAA
jgi:cellulose synthase/poly-beta-1,6-N-acetylglucosamine synthase-like glycosyltransferase